MTEIPSSFYYLIGFLILTNLGSVASLLWFGIKAVWWVSKLESKVDMTHEDVDRAHERLDRMELKFLGK